MTESPLIYVFCGGLSSERDVSLVTGRHVYEALQRKYRTELVVLERNELPALDFSRAVVFPAMHGEFGEDGRLQGLLEDKGILYAGSDRLASALCMLKPATKERVAASGFHFARHAVFEISPSRPLPAVHLPAGFRFPAVLKPANLGSSVGLQFPGSLEAFNQSLPHLKPGVWMVEERLYGRELSIGLLEGEPLGVVEIKPVGGVYDFNSKYTAGSTEYQFPAPVDASLTARIESCARVAFQLAGCRDFARIDVILVGSEPYFLEINTLPGMTPSSLLPKSASCRGLIFDELVYRMIQPALRRFNHRLNNRSSR